MNKYIVVCFAIHEQDISNYKTFTEEDAAYDYMEKIAEELYESTLKYGYSPQLTIDGDVTHLIINDKKHKNLHWVWKVLDI